MKVFRTALLCSLFLMRVASSALAGDWPQILGPHRNAISDDEKLVDSLPKGGPKRVWSSPVGSGFAGVVVAEGTAIVFHRLDSKDQLTAFHADTGDKLWSVSFPTSFQPQIVEDDGPRATPTIQNGAVYACSAQGKLYCVDFKTGDKRWERDTFADFGANGGYFGAGSSPLVEGDLVIVNVGGDRKKAGVVAFHTKDGTTAWTAVADQASYAAPVAKTIDNVRHLLCITRLNFVSLNPQTGEVRFQTPFGQRGPTVNGACPVISGDHILLTASYGIGAEWLKVSSDHVDVEWSDEILSSQYTTPILFENAVIGVDGRQDGGPATLKCFDPMSRKKLWSKPDQKYSTLISADGKLLIMQTDGVLRLARLSKDRYDELAAVSLLAGTTRALPALANGRFYLRNETTLVCIDLRRPE